MFDLLGDLYRLAGMVCVGYFWNDTKACAGSADTRGEKCFLYAAMIAFSYWFGPIALAWCRIVRDQAAPEEEP